MNQPWAFLLCLESLCSLGPSKEDREEAGRNTTKQQLAGSAPKPVELAWDSTNVDMQLGASKTQKMLGKASLADSQS
jgi:hypothetical protein